MPHRQDPPDGDRSPLGPGADVDPGGVADLTDFERLVLEAVGSLERGEVSTYGEVAAEIGKPGAARAVGSVLRRHGGSVPWWRVVAANGRLVPGSELRHTKKLEADGVTVRNGRVVMSGAGSDANQSGGLGEMV